MAHLLALSKGCCAEIQAVCWRTTVLLRGDFYPVRKFGQKTLGEKESAVGEWESCVIFTVFTTCRKGKTNLVGSDLLSDYTQQRERWRQRVRESWLVSGVAACNDWVAPLAEVEVGPADINLKPISSQQLRLSQAALAGGILNTGDKHLPRPNKHVDNISSLC